MPLPELSNRELTDIFEESEVGKKAIAERERRHHTKRKAAADAILDIEAKKEQDFSKTQADYDSADAEYHSAFAAFKAANDKRAATYRVRSSVIALAELAKRPHETILRETVDPTIAALSSEIAKAHCVAPTLDAIRTQHEAIVARKNAQLTAMRELDELWREPLSGADLHNRLSNIRQRALNGHTNGFAHSKN